MLLRCQLRLHLFRDRLFHFRSEGHRLGVRRLPSSAVPVIGLRLIVLRCCVGPGFSPGVVSGLQIRRDQVIGKPERRRRIHRVGREISAVVAIPGSPAPAPNSHSPIHRRAPRTICPSVKGRVVPVARVVAIIVTAAVVVTAIDADAIDPVVIVSARIKGTAAARDVGPLHVAAATAPGHDPHSSSFGHDGATAAQIVLNPHSVAVDGANLPVWPKAGRPTAPQSYRAPGGAAAVHASAIIRGVSAAVAGGSSTLIGDVSAAIAGIVSVVARRVSAAVVTRALRPIAGVRGTIGLPARVAAVPSARGGSLDVRVLATGTRCAAGSAFVALATGAARIALVLTLPS